MSAPSSEELRRVRCRRGSTLVLMTAALTFGLAVIALGLEVGRLYVLHARLSRTADAASIAGARALRLGTETARNSATSVVAANGFAARSDGPAVSVDFGTGPADTRTVTTSITLPAPVAARMFGAQTITVRSRAVVASPPVDLILVMDQSESLEGSGGWGPVRQSVKNFIAGFSPTLDRVGLVSFHYRGVDRLTLQHGFSAAVPNAIDALATDGGSNPGEALQIALQQFQAATVRPGAVRVVVLFTDGPPSTLRTLVHGSDAYMAAESPDDWGSHGSWNGWKDMYGYWDKPERLPIEAEDWKKARSCNGAKDCNGWDAPMVVQQAANSARDAADQLRAQGVLVYTVGLRNPGFTADEEALLRELANELGISDPSQPQGRAFFVSRPNELGLQFARLLESIPVRLTE